MIFRARDFQFRFPRPTLVMGIVNVTPDSFSDGGLYLDPYAAIKHALSLVEQGADILDIGGESTRPKALPVAEAEELRRVMPVLEGLAGRVNVPISIDTMKPEVARQALEAGASIVNDVAALRNDPKMWQLVRETGAGYVCMHMRGDPRTMQDEPVYQDVVREVDDFFTERLRQLEDNGIQAEQIILDPGIGFGKNLEHNLQLIAASGHFARRGRPVLLGVSRKSFMNRLLGSGGEALLPASLACACFAVQAGVQLVRVHDVAETVKAVRMTEGIVARRIK